MFAIGYGLFKDFETLFAKYSGFPCENVAFFDEDPDGFPGLLDRDRSGSGNALGNRIGIGVNREFRRTFARFAHRDRFPSVVDRGALAFGFERKERGHEKMGGFVRQYRTPGGRVVPGGSSRSNHEESVAPKPDGGMSADFDVERDEMSSGGLYLRLVEGLSFRRTVFGLEAHVEERVFEFPEFRIGASENRRVGEKESLGSEVHSEERNVFAGESFYRAEHGAVSTEYGDGAFIGFRKKPFQFVGREGFVEFALSFGKPGVEYDGSTGDVQGFEAGHGVCGYGLDQPRIRALRTWKRRVK